jgi:hypothetical protein
VQLQLRTVLLSLGRETPTTLSLSREVKALLLLSNIIFANTYQNSLEGGNGITLRPPRGISSRVQATHGERHDVGVGR